MASSGSAAAVAVEGPDGLYMVGEFLGYRVREPRTIGTAERQRIVENVDIGLRLPGGAIETVQYGAMKYAEAAVGAAQVGDRVALPVENRHGVKNGQAWQFFTGARAPGASSAFEEEFRG